MRVSQQNTMYICGLYICIYFLIHSFVLWQSVSRGLPDVYFAIYEDGKINVQITKRGTQVFHTSKNRRHVLRSVTFHSDPQDKSRVHGTNIVKPVVTLYTRLRGLDNTLEELKSVGPHLYTAFVVTQTDTNYIL